jgi:hypothetical protein
MGGIPLPGIPLLKTAPRPAPRGACPFGPYACPRQHYDAGLCAPLFGAWLKHQHAPIMRVSCAVGTRRVLSALPFNKGAGGSRPVRGAGRRNRDVPLCPPFVREQVQEQQDLQADAGSREDQDPPDNAAHRGRTS